MRYLNNIYTEMCTKNLEKLIATLIQEVRELKRNLEEGEPKIDKLKGNKKRIDSCKKIGGEKKKTGHNREILFEKQYNPNKKTEKIEYGAKADTEMDKSKHIYQELVNKLKVKGNNVSNKSGNNIQFTLGNIPELLDISIIQLNNKQLILEIMGKYLKKNGSDKPADILVYLDMNKKEWLFFNMDYVIEFIADNCDWRILESGRIKGDFKDKSKKGKRQYLTYEYRQTHNSYFLGANGGKGSEFIVLLMNNIPYMRDSLSYSS